MATLVNAMDRVLALAGKRVVRFGDRGGMITVEASSTGRAAPRPDCRCWSGRLHGIYAYHPPSANVIPKVLVVSSRSMTAKRAGARTHWLLSRHQPT